MTASDRGLGDGASPVRDDRTWTLRWTQTNTSVGRVCTADGPFIPFDESVEVVPRSELARVQDELDQAREALKEAEGEIDTMLFAVSALPARSGRVSVGNLRPAVEGLRRAHLRVLIALGSEDPDVLAAAAASGVTEKGDGTDG